MKVAVIGTGKMGRGFAHAFAPKHELVVGLRDPDRARVTAASTGAAAGATYADASAQADVVILTVPWTAMDETLAELGDLQDVVVVDVSYPDNQQQREALEGRSTAEVIQSRLPHARVFKGWNHVHAKHSTDLEVDGIGASVLIAGDDPGARQIVFALARDMGFHLVDAGLRRATRVPEKLVGVMP